MRHRRATRVLVQGCRATLRRPGFLGRFAKRVAARVIDLNEFGARIRVVEELPLYRSQLVDLWDTTTERRVTGISALTVWQHRDPEGDGFLAGLCFLMNKDLPVRVSCLLTMHRKSRSRSGHPTDPVDSGSGAANR